MGVSIHICLAGCSDNNVHLGFLTDFYFHKSYLPRFEDVAEEIFRSKVTEAVC